MSWNIWFGDFEKFKRIEYIAEIIKKLQPDFVGLQELTPITLKYLLNQEWFRFSYHTTDNIREIVVPYGTGLFSRHPANWTVHDLPSKMGRRLVTAQVDNVMVGSVHLESLDESKRRKKQLAKCFGTLTSSSTAILMGDMNFDTPEVHPISPGFADVWLAECPSDPGYTRDTEENLMAKLNRQEEKRKRIDRIFLKSAEVKTTAIERLGTQPLEDPTVFASDHFGLHARFEKV